MCVAKVKEKWKKCRYTFEIIDDPIHRLRNVCGRYAGYGAGSVSAQTDNHVFRRYGQFAMRLWKFLSR